MANRHIDQAVVESNLPPLPDQAGEVAIIAVHGRNQTPAFMEEVIMQIGWQDLPVIYPVAANQTWYPDKFMGPYERNRSGLEDAMNVVQQCRQRLNQQGFSDEKIILMGFSQGACLISHYALSNPGKYKAIFILTGGFVGEKGRTWSFDGDFSETPVLVTTSKIDEWVPPQRAEETATAFANLNANVRFELFENRPHVVSEEEIEIMRKMRS